MAVEDAAGARAGNGYRLFVTGLEVPCRIGIYPHERQTPQRIKVDVALDLDPAALPVRDDIAGVYSYETIVEVVRDLTRDGHVGLVETLAGRIAERCLEDRRVTWASVRVAKLDILAGGAEIGVLLERGRKRGTA